MNAGERFTGMGLSYQVMVTLLGMVTVFYVGVITWLAAARLSQFFRTKRLTRTGRSEKKVEVAG